MQASQLEVWNALCNSQVLRHIPDRCNSDGPGFLPRSCCKKNTPGKLLRSVRGMNDLFQPLVIIVVPVAVVVIFVVPVAFVQLPPLLIVIVVGMVPIGALVWWLLPVSLDPSVVASVRCPIALDPTVTRPGCVAPPLISKRRRSASDVKRNLGKRRDRDCHHQQQAAKPFQSHYFFLL